jgi:hypothetical protein
LEIRRVPGCLVFERGDAPFPERDADQQGDDGLGHRERRKLVRRRTVVLVSFVNDRIALEDEQTGDPLPREDVVDREGVALVLVPEWKGR